MYSGRYYLGTIISSDSCCYRLPVLGGATVEQTWRRLVVSSFRFALGIAVGRHACNASYLTAKFESIVVYKLIFFLFLLHLSSSRPFPSPFPSCIVRTAKRQLSRPVIDKLYTELIAIFNPKFQRDNGWPNLDIHGSITIIFGTSVAEKVGNQNVLYFPTSPNVCFCTTWGNRKPKNCVFSLKCCTLLPKTRRNTLN